MKKLIHICGTGRSGSTVMDLIIGSTENSRSLGEINAFYYPYRSHHMDAICSCGNKNCSEINNIKKLTRDNIHFKLLQNDQTENLVDSSKSLVWIFENINILKNKNIEIFNLVLIKSFKSYSHSIWKRGDNINLAYRKYTNYYSNLLNSGIKYSLINQDDLIHNKKIVSKKIKNHTGILIRDESFNFWNFEHHYFFGSPSARNQISNKTKQNTRKFEKKFQIEYDCFMNDKKKNILNKLKVRLEKREYKKFKPTLSFKLWFIFKKFKISILSKFTKAKSQFLSL